MQQQYDLAIKELDTSIRLKPDLAEAHQDMGNCRLGKGDTAGAIGDFSKLIEKKQDSPVGYYRLAVAHELANQNADAIADLGAVINGHVMNIEPGQKALAFFYRALAYETKGDTDSAERDFASAIALDEHLSLERQWVEYLKSISQSRPTATTKIGRASLTTFTYLSGLSRTDATASSKTPSSRRKPPRRAHPVSEAPQQATQRAGTREGPPRNEHIKQNRPILVVVRSFWWES